MSLDDSLKDTTQALRTASWWLELLRKILVFFKGTSLPLIMLGGSTAGTYLLSLLGYLGEPGFIYLIVGALILAILLTYVAYRARSYRESYKRIVEAHAHIHGACHSVNDAMARRTIRLTTSLSDAVNETKEIAKIRQSHALSDNAKHILDQAVFTMRQITRQGCTASLVMPYHTEADGNHFRTILYCSDTNPIRIQGRRSKQSSFIELAYKSPTPVIVYDYIKEAKKGNRTGLDYREDSFKTYRSAILRRVETRCKVYGVLCIDSPTPNVFFSGHTNTISMFADLLGIVFLLSDYDMLSENEYP